MNLVRGLILIFGGLLVLGGLAGLTVGGTSAAAGAWGVVVGLILIAAILLEQQRYRSAEAEQTAARPGPGGGEPPDVPLDPRFGRTDEVFVDPTTHVRMRVWLDPSSGERRYVADQD